MTGNRVEIASCPEPRPADIRIYLTDHARLTGFGGWRPRRDARATLADIFEWIRREEALVREVLAG
jgi:CDP-paratose 2-epimerase